MTPIFYIKHGYLSFADNIIISDFDLFLYAGDKICITGKNGSGKSSLMKVITGEYILDKGELFTAPNIKIGYLQQNMNVNLSLTVGEFLSSNESHNLTKILLKKTIINELKLDLEAILRDCSGGNIRKVNLAKTLLAESDILLLDEPTNHLDITTIEWLENYLKVFKGAVLCISHDREFLNNITNKICWIRQGVMKKFDQGFKYFDEWQEKVIIQENIELQKLNKKLLNEQNWLNAGVTGRRKRNQKRLSDLKQLRAKLQNDTDRLSDDSRQINLTLEANSKKSQFILEVKNLSYKINEQYLIKNFSQRIKKGEKIAVIGANGSGKTTFIKLLTKELMPYEGEIIHGSELKISYFDQHRNAINEQLTLQEFICENGGDQVFLQNNNMHVSAYLKQFMFDPKQLNIKISTLSGGQISRLLLAKVLINPGNLLILDEPTNDLDIETLDVLENILTKYSGTLIIVSHDRDFLEQIVTRTVVFIKSQIIDLIGGYSDYQNFLKENLSEKNAKIDHAKSSLNKTIKIGTKLTYKDQRFMDNLASEISNLDSQKQQIELKLSSNDLYSKAFKTYKKLIEELEYCNEKLDKIMIRWVEIEEIMEKKINKKF